MLNSSIRASGGVTALFLFLTRPDRKVTVVCEKRDLSIDKIDGTTVLFKNYSEFEGKRKRLIDGGSRRLQVVMDFDYTMTKFFTEGHKRGASCHCLIEDSGFLSAEYRTQAKALFNYYYPLEVSPNLTLEEKIPLMKEWVDRAHDLLLTSGLRKRHIKYAVAEALHTNSISLRDGVAAMLAQLDANRVPVLLFSAGIADVIEEVLLQQAGAISPHLHIVSNHLIFEKHGDNDHVVGFSKPSYHVFNKTARSATHSPFFKTHDLKHREHLILLGDSLGDVAMADGLSCNEECTIRIGFLNDKIERLPEYLAANDVVIVGDPSFKFPASLLDDIIGNISEVKK